MDEIELPNVVRTEHGHGIGQAYPFEGGVVVLGQYESEPVDDDKRLSTDTPEPYRSRM